MVFLMKTFNSHPASTLILTFNLSNLAPSPNSRTFSPQSIFMHKFVFINLISNLHTPQSSLLSLKFLHLMFLFLHLNFSLLMSISSCTYWQKVFHLIPYFNCLSVKLLKWSNYKLTLCQLNRFHTHSFYPV